MLSCVPASSGANTRFVWCCLDGEYHTLPPQRVGIKKKSLCLRENQRITAPLYLTQKGGYTSSQDTASTYIIPNNISPMKRKTMRYALVALGAGLLSLASCGGQATENGELISRRHYTSEERAKIEHTRALMNQYLPGWELGVPAQKLDETYLNLADTMIIKWYHMVQKSGLFSESQPNE